MRTLIDKTKQALLKTVDLLATEFRIHSWDFLSYEALVVVIYYIYANTNYLSLAQVSRVRQWFWRASFSERYKVGGENFVSRDLKTVYDFVIEAGGSPADFGPPPSDTDWMSIQFRSNVSRSRAYMLALAACSPRNLSNGAQIDTASALSSYNRKQFHHVYPRAYLRRSSTSKDDNLLINICMLAAAGNNAISDANPNEYLPACIATLNTSANAVFASNLLPLPSSFNYSTATYSEFLEARAGIVEAFVSKLCNGDVS